MVLLAGAALVAYDMSRAGDATAPAAHGGPALEAAPDAGATGGSAPSGSVPVVVTGPGTFTFSRSQGPVAGWSGAVHRYRVAVEDGVGIAPEEFAATVESLLGDPRGWTAGGDLRLQRVPGGSAAAFTVYLATPATSQRLCREGWMETNQYTNCRLSDGRVVINLARWLTGVPNYGALVEVYRAYAINHEVGHQLRNGHELCPGSGQPAPVMQQQTLGLAGCVANGWPYVGGVRYRGQAASQ